jgi:menaquinone-9 beta-reductase
MALGDAAGRAWDAVVVGAGPAGSVAAHELARSGAAVLLVDKASFPRAKPCGCCLNSAASGMLERLGIADSVLQSGVGRPEQLDLRIGGTRSAGARFRLRGSVAVARDVLDSALVSAAAAQGAVFLDGTAARLGAAKGDHREVELRAGCASVRARARVIIAADGLGGTLLRDEPGLQPAVGRGSRIGAAVTLAPESAGQAFGPGVIWMTCGRGGYVGAVRLGDGRLHLAAALDPGLVRIAGDPGRAAARILSEAGRPLPDGLMDSRWRGTPRLMRRRRVAGKRVLVIGDAAGYVEPFTGEGMAWAIMSARELVPFALGACRGDDVGRAWMRRHAAMMGSRQRLCRALSWVVRRPRLSAGAVRLAAGVPALCASLLRWVERPHEPVGAGAGA